MTEAQLYGVCLMAGAVIAFGVVSGFQLGTIKFKNWNSVDVNTPFTRFTQVMFYVGAFMYEPGLALTSTWQCLVYGLAVIIGEYSTSMGAMMIIGSVFKLVAGFGKWYSKITLPQTK